jgi:hypothetical protein
MLCKFDRNSLAYSFTKLPLHLHFIHYFRRFLFAQTCCLYALITRLCCSPHSAPCYTCDLVRDASVCFKVNWITTVLLDNASFQLANLPALFCTRLVVGKPLTNCRFFVLLSCRTATTTNYFLLSAHRYLLDT